MKNTLQTLNLFDFTAVSNANGTEADEVFA